MTNPCLPLRARAIRAALFCAALAAAAPAQAADYTGIVHERRAKAQLRHNAPGSGPRVYGWLREAMLSYEKAETLRPAGNDDALLRWNACARLLMRDQHLVPAIEEPGELLFLE